MPINKQRWLRKAPALLFLGIASYVFLRSNVYKAPHQIDFAALQLRELDGTPLPSSLTTARPVVLNFWAPWCGPCRMEMPWLNHLQQTHPDVTIVGLEDDTTALDQAISLQESQHFSYPLIASSSLTRAAFGHVAGLPTTLYISRSGRVIHTVTGMVPESVMQMYLDDTVKQN